MNYTKKIIFAGIAALAGTAQAQVYSPDGRSSLLMQTDALSSSVIKGGFGLFATCRGVGWDKFNFASQFGATSSLSTARTQFNRIKYVGPTVAAGSKLQIGLHATAISRSLTAPNTTVYVSIYTYNGSVASGQVPLGTAVVRNMKVVVAELVGNPQPIPLFSSTVGAPATTAALINGSEYVIVVAGNDAAGASSAANFVVLGTNATNAPGTSISTLSAGDQSLFKFEYARYANSADSPGAYSTSTSDGRMLAFRLYQFSPFATKKPGLDGPANPGGGENNGRG